MRWKGLQLSPSFFQCVFFMEVPLEQQCSALHTPKISGPFAWQKLPYTNHCFAAKSHQTAACWICSVAPKAITQFHFSASILLSISSLGFALRRVMRDCL